MIYKSAFAALLMALALPTAAIAAQSPEAVAATATTAFDLRAEQLVDLLTEQGGQHVEAVGCVGLCELLAGQRRQARQHVHLADQRVVEDGFDLLKRPVRRVVTPDVPIPFSPAMEKPLYPGRDSIAAAARSLF